MSVAIDPKEVRYLQHPASKKVRDTSGDRLRKIDLASLDVELREYMAKDLETANWDPIDHLLRD